MKKKFLFLMTLLAVSLFALAEMRLNVYHKDGTKTFFIASEVDSIGFEDYKAEENPTRGYENGYEWVDLGLPSGTKWATMNVGADSPAKSGQYFVFGGTQAYVNGDCEYRGTSTILPLSADAANVNWGGNWRMPTIEDFEELQEPNRCKWEWVLIHGMYGYKITSVKNGNSIFLPAVGVKILGELNDYNENGYYRTSSSFTSGVYQYVIHLTSEDLRFIQHSYRCNGCSIRPVLK